MKTVLDNLKGKLVVSCQALENEPLHSPFIMSRMALAAAQGGAAAIRANSVVDIKAIKGRVSLPVIGIIKRDYPDSEVFITDRPETARWRIAGHADRADPHPLPFAAADGGYCHRAGGRDRAGAGV